MIFKNNFLELGRKMSSGFYITFSNASRFRHLIELCKELLNDVNVTITSKGMEMQSMDMSHVSLIYFFLSSESFKEYTVWSNTTLSLSLKNLLTVLKCCKDDYQLSLSCNSNQPDHLDIVMTRQNKKLELTEDSQQQYTFHMNLMHMECECLQIPEEEYDCTVTMDANHFSECVKNAGSIGDTIEIRTIGKLLEFTTSGDIGKVSMCQSFSRQTMKCPRGQNLSIQLSLRYLQTFSKGGFFSPKVCLMMREEQPIRVRYEDALEKSILEFYLAPKFDDN